MIKGVKTIKKRRANGEVRVYRYHRDTGRPILVEPDAPGFRDAVKAAAVPKEDGDLAEYKRRARLEVERLTHNVRISASSRKILVTVTAKDFLAIGEAQGWVCAVSGLRFETRPYSQRAGRCWPLRMSVDRINSKRPYEPGNIRLVCHAVNTALGDWGDEITIKIALAIAIKAGVATPTTAGERQMAGAQELLSDKWKSSRVAPEGVVVYTKIDDAKGARNYQNLIRRGKLWFFPDESMYVYYTPTHWMPAQERENA